MPYIEKGSQRSFIQLTSPFSQAKFGTFILISLFISQSLTGCARNSSNLGDSSTLNGSNQKAITSNVPIPNTSVPPGGNSTPSGTNSNSNPSSTPQPSNPTPPPSSAPSNPSTSSGASCVSWKEGLSYTVGEVVLFNGQTYTDLVPYTAYPGTNWDPAGGGRTLWTPGGSCSGSGSNPTSPSTGPGTTSTPTPTPTPTTPETPIPPSSGSKTPPGFVFSPYKDITINMDWNTNVLRTSITGTPTKLLDVMPSGLKTITFAFASGECGSENWGGVTPAAFVAANRDAFVNAGKSYIISTGGANGVFTCSSDAGFSKFISTYYSAGMLGVDFDIEGGQSPDVISNLVQRVIVAQKTYPGLRFSFTLQTLGSTGSDLNPLGISVVQAIQNAHLQNYTIDLMTMDYGAASSGVCTLGSNNLCDMGQSAISAAKSLNSNYNIPLNQIELCPMIGGNDAQDETTTLANVAAIAQFALQNHLAGLHFWSIDRDTDCGPGAASPTCNNYGRAGTLGFTNQFLSSLNLK